MSERLSVKVADHSQASITVDVEFFNFQPIRNFPTEALNWEEKRSPESAMRAQKIETLKNETQNR